MTTAIVTAICLGPSAFLVAWALWIKFTQPDDDPFLDEIDDWGAQ